MKIRRMICIASLFSFLCVFLGGCAPLMGNAPLDIKEAVKTVEDRYDIDLTLRRIALFPGGATCDVITGCKELPGRDIRIFRFDHQAPVHSDYIYQKYGDEAYDRICRTVHTIYPEALIVVEDSNYNHFTADWYNADTTIEDYLLDNQLRVNIVLAADFDEETLLREYHRTAETLSGAGINSHGLGIYCMEDRASVDAVKTYEHLPDHQSYEGIPTDSLLISVTNNYGSVRDYLEDPDAAGIVVNHGNSDP